MFPFLISARNPRGFLQPFPQVGIGNVIDVIEINDAIRATVHRRERDRIGLHDRTLAYAFSVACGLEEPLAMGWMRVGTKLCTATKGA